MKIPFTQINAFVANSYKLTYTHIMGYKPQISFLDYVKSQLHTNIVTDLYGRSILSYYNTYLYLMGDEHQINNFKQVVGWYYKDLASFILNSIGTMEDDFSILESCNIPQKHIGMSKVSIRKVYDDLKVLLVDRQQVIDPQFDYFQYLEKVPIELRKDLKPSHILAEALAMAYVADNEIGVLDINN